LAAAITSAINAALLSSEARRSASLRRRHITSPYANTPIAAAPSSQITSFMQKV